MDNRVIIIGEKLKQFRTAKKMKLYEVAARSEISKGLLSKIENGRTIPSLPVLLQILRTLETELADFFREVEMTSEKSGYILLPKSGFQHVKKEDSTGYRYYNIFQQSFTSVAISFFYLELDPGAKRDLVTTDGYEFIYLISGDIEYILGKEAVRMEQGDALFFDGTIPHVKRNLTDKTASLLVIYFLTSINI